MRTRSSTGGWGLAGERDYAFPVRRQSRPPSGKFGFTSSTAPLSNLRPCTVAGIHPEVTRAGGDPDGVTLPGLIGEIRDELATARVDSWRTWHP